MTSFAQVWIELLASSENGRTTPVYLAGSATAHYRPHLVVHGGDGQMLGVEFVAGPEGPLLPGSAADATVRCLYEPAISYDALLPDATFDVIEGPHTVARGRVIRRYASGAA